MNLLTALIIDDEVDARRIIVKYLERYAPNIAVVGEADSVLSGVESIKKIKPSIVFLDINMSDGTGFDLLDNINPIDFKVIFTTAFDHYAVKAFRYHAVDYLLKPIDPEAFVEAIEHVSKEEKSVINENLLALLNQTRNVDKKLALPTSEGLKFVTLDQIEFIEADGSYCEIYLSDARNILISKPLKYFSDKLVNENSFLRAHKSYLLNINHVNEYVKEDGGMLRMKNGKMIPISRQKKEEVLNAMSQFFL